VAGLGFVLWLAVVAAVQVRRTRAGAASRAAACALAGWLVDGLVNGPLHVPPSSALCWLLLGIALRGDDAGDDAASPRRAGIRTVGLAALALLVLARAFARDLAGEAYALRGSVALARGEPAVALPALARASALAIEDRRHHFECGRAWFMMGAFDDAAREFEIDVALNPCVHSGWHNLGLCLDRLGRRREALAAFRTAALLNPRDADTRSMIGATGAPPRHGKL
jgi:tetratricopeptide (TPR) repeat protein